MEGHISALLREKGRFVYRISHSVMVSDAVREMIEKGVGSLVVYRGDDLVGILTERDVLKGIVDTNSDAAHTRVAEVMTADVPIIEPSSKIEQAMAVMTESRCRHLPVVENGKVVGLISIGDVTRWASRNHEATIRSYEEYITGHQR